jgi:hypothetical protein
MARGLLVLFSLLFHGNYRPLRGISQQDALRLLAATVSFLDREVCADIHTPPLFLLVWNMAALRYERGADRAFQGILPDALVEILLTVLRERVHPKVPTRRNSPSWRSLASWGFCYHGLPKSFAASWGHSQA